MIALLYCYFFFLLFVSFYIPGNLLLKFVQRKFTNIEGFFFSFVIGTGIFFIVSLTLAFLKASQVMIFILELFFILFLFRKHFSLVKQHKHETYPNIMTLAIKDGKEFLDRVKRIQRKHFDLFTLILFLFCVLIIVSPHFFSGMQTHEGMRFYGNDATRGLEHIAWIKLLLIHPPSTLFQSYDFLLSRFVYLFGLTPEDSYFRLFPLYNAFLFLGSIFLIFKKFGAKKLMIRSMLLFFSLIIGLLLLQRSHQPTRIVSMQEQRFFEYITKEVEPDAFILYLPSLHKDYAIEAFTGRQVLLPSNQNTLQSALKRCQEKEVQEILRTLGSRYIFSEKKEPCLASEKIRGTKVASKKFFFYEIDLH